MARLRMFSRFHSPEEHDALVEGLLEQGDYDSKSSCCSIAVVQVFVLLTRRVNMKSTGSASKNLRHENSARMTPTFTKTRARPPLQREDGVMMRSSSRSITADVLVQTHSTGKRGHGASNDDDGWSGSVTDLSTSSRSRVVI